MGSENRTSTKDIPFFAAVRERLTVPLIMVALGLGLLFVWLNAGHLLIIFTAILVASFFDTCTRGLGLILPVKRVWRLSFVLLALAAISIPALIRGVANLPAQARALIRVMDSQLDKLHLYLTNFGIEILGTEDGRDFSQILPDPTVLFGHFQLALGSVTSLVAGLVIVLCLGAFFAADPKRYSDGVLCLFPKERRARMQNVMGEMGSVIRGWFLGQVIRVALSTLALWAVFYLFGLPGAFLLAFQAGVSNFIPYIGPFIAAIPVALVSMPQGTEGLIWIMAIYFLIQNLEGYILAPIVHRGTVQVSPAWTLAGVVILGSAFGVIGMALATPILALLRVAVLRFYVEDYLQDHSGAKKSSS